MVHCQCAGMVYGNSCFASASCSSVVIISATRCQRAKGHSTLVHMHKQGAGGGTYLTMFAPRPGQR